MKKIYLLLLLCCVSVAAFATKIVCPSTLNGGSGGGTACQNGTITLSFTLTTCTSGSSGSTTQSNINVTWYQNTTGSPTGGTIVSGPTASTTSTTTYTFTPSTSAVGTFYYYPVVTWTATGTCQTSSTVTASGTQSVTVTNSGATAGTAAASKISGCTPYSSTLSLTGTSPSGLSYQWQSSSDGITFVPISGATTASYAATVNGPTFYECSAGCALGTAVLSSTVQVSANIASVSTSAASKTTGCTPYSSTLSLTGASPTTGLVYQWQSSPDGITFTPISGATTSSYAATVNGATIYECSLSCTAGAAVISPTVAVTANIPISGTVSATATSGCGTYNSTLSLTGASTGTPTYQWQSSTDNINFNLVSGATNATYAAVVSSNIYYECAVACAAGTLTATTASKNLGSPSFGSLPYAEGFESITSNNTLPSCMSSNSLGTYCLTNLGSYTTSGSVTMSAHGGSNFALFNYQAIGDYFWTPAFNLTGGTNYQFSFWYRTDGTGGSSGNGEYNAVVQYGTSQTTGAMTNSIGSISNFNNTAYTQFTGTFTPTSSGVYFIGIGANNTNGSTDWDWAFDDIGLISLSPTFSVSPTSINFGNVPVGSGSASQSFNLSGTYLTGFPGTITVNAPTNYQVSVDNINWNTTASISYTAATLANTPVYVRANVPSASTYTGSVTITPTAGVTLPPSVSVSATGTPPCSVPIDQPTAINFTAPIGTSATVTLTDASPPTGYVLIASIGAFTGTIVNGTTYTVGTVIGNGTVVGTSTSTTVSMTGLTANAINTITVFPYTNSGTCAGPVYNTVNPLTGTIATCLAAPTSLTVSNLGPNGFALNWNASSGATSYQVDVATNSGFTTLVNGSPFIVAATTPTVTTTIGGLTASTIYYYRVTAIGGSCNSIATATSSVTTTAGGTIITVSSGFNYDVIANGAGTTVPLSTTVGTGGYDGTGYVYFGNDYYVANGGSTGYTGLPNSGYFTSANTAGIPYQLANYSNPNCLYLAAATAGNTGTLNFTTPAYASTLYILGNVGSGGGSCVAETVNLTITYTDNTTQTGSVAFGDWYSCTPIALATIGRVGQTNGFDGTSSGPNFYEKNIAITTYAKPIKNVQFTTTAGTGYLGIFALSVRAGTLSVSTGSLAFGNVTQTCTSAAQIFSVSGSYLYPSGGNITVTAPTGFLVSSSSAGTYAATATLAYTSTVATNVPVYVKFNPSTTGTITGNLTFSGGTVNTPPIVTVSGTGTVAPTPQAITGNTSFCYGAVTTSTLTETVAGGTWSSTSPTVATVDNSGDLTIAGVGTTTIIYSLTTCSITNTVSTLVTVSAGATALVTPSGTVTACGSQTLTATTGSNYAYQWYNGSGAISGATNSTYILSSTGSVSTTNTYSVQVTNSLTTCSSTSAGTTVTLSPSPTASVTPAGTVSVCGSQLLTAGTNIGNVYQWYNSTGIISGATNNTYTAVNTGSVSAASTYSVQVTNSASTCSSTSAGTVLTLNAIPTASVTPSGTVTACGSQTLTATSNIGNQYQWYNGSGIIAGATNNIYVASTGSVSATNSYSVVVTNSATNCNSTSVATTVTLNPVPTATITTPGGITSACGNNIVMTGNTNIGDTYQWSNSSGTISGATAGTYTATVTGTYSVNIKQNSTGCNLNSATTAININAIPTASMTPTGTLTVCGTQTLTASTDIGNAYQWYNTSGIIAGATGSTYVAANTGSVATTNTYSVVVTNSLTTCSNASTAATVTLNPVPTATVTTPGNITANCADIVMTANTNIGNTYQWSNSSGTIAGATSNTYTATISSTYTVNIKQNSTSCNANSAGIVISIVPPPSASVSPSVATTTCGSQVLTAITDFGNAYQWYNSSGVITGATNSTYTAVNAGTVSATNTYSVAITNTVTNCGNTSPATTVTLYPMPSASVSPTGTVTACGTQTLTAGTNIGNAYQWYNGSGAIGGATNSTYALSNTGSTSVTNTYSVQVTNTTTACNVMSAGTTVILNAIPTASVTPSGTVTACGSQLLTAGTNIGNKYQWYNSSGIISGATNSTYNASNTGTVVVTTAYSVQVTNSLTTCNLTSAGTTVTLNPIPTASVTPTGTVTACGTQTLTAGTNIGNAYQWYNGSGSISGATNSTYALSNTGATSVTNTYSVQVTNTTTTCNIMSPGTTVILNAIPTASVSPTGTVTTCGSQLLIAGTNIGTVYQWYSSTGGSISGATNSTYTANNAGSVSVTAVYFVQVTNSSTTCNLTSAGTTVTLNPIPTASISPTGTVTNCGSQVLSAGTNIGNVYQWYNSSGIIAGATNNTYAAINSGSVSVTSTYSVVVTNSVTSCNNTSTATTVILNPGPTSVVSPSGTVTVCGSELLTALTNIGNSYQWYNGSGIISGATGSSYSVVNGGATSVTNTYSVVVTNSLTTCNSTSPATTVILNAVPTSSVTPAGTVTACGSQVLIAGTNIGNRYQWYNGSGIITGATNNSYTVSNTGSIATTDVYSVMVTNSGTTCNSTSAGTTVILNPIPTASILPTGTVTACGSELLTAGSNIGNVYQWYSNTGGAVSGATNNTYTAINNGSVSVTAIYSVQVTNSSTTCNLTSAGTTVILNPIPTSSVTPAGTVTACGSQVLTAGTNIGNRYQWYNGSGIITGATNNSYTVSNTGSVATTDVYSVMVTNSGTTCNSTSAGTTVILNPIPTASVTPAGTVTACGSELLTAGSNIGNVYQWYSNTGGAVSGATNNTYTAINNGSVSVTAIYSVQVTNSSTTCNLTSAGTTVILNPIPTSSVTPAGTVTACGSQVLTAGTNIGNRYQWYNGSGIITGATNNSYTVSNTGSVATTDVYSVMVTNSGTTCNSTSAGTTVILNPIPASTVTTAGGLTTNCGSLVLTGTSNIGDTYQWYNSSGAIAGATNLVYTATVSSTYYMKAGTAATGCNSNSASFVITINPYPVVTVTASGPTTFCAGSSVTLATNSGYTYQWQNYGVNIAGATNNSYTSSQGGIFRVALSSPASCLDTTSSTTVTVNPLPSETITAGGPLAFCAGGSVILSAQTGLSTYQWVNPVNGVGGANSNTYTATASGSYRVVMTTNSNCRDTSMVLVVTAEPLPNNTVTVSGATTFCEGGSVTLTGPSGMSSYQWHDGAAAIGGAAGQSYSTGTSGTYKVFISNGQCSDSSVAQVVTNASADTSIAITGSYRAVPGGIAICTGNALSLNGVSGAGSYQWDSATVAIPGANSQNYAVTETGVYTLIMNSSFGCKDSVSRKVEVDTLPVPVIYEYGYGLQTTQVYSSYQWYLNGVAIPGATSRDYLASTEGPYTVEVTNADDCSGMSASKTLNNLGVGNITGIDISLYPNPSSSVVYIQSPVKVKAVVYTIEGQEIVNKEDAKSIDLGRFANGTYMIKLFGEDGNLLKVSKLVKSE